MRTAYQGKTEVQCATCFSRFWGKDEGSAKYWLRNHHCLPSRPKRITVKRASVND